MSCLKNLFSKQGASGPSQEDHDTTLEQLIISFNPQTIQERAMFLLRCEYVINEMRQRMVHANFAEKRRLSQQLEFYETKYFEIGGKRFKPGKRDKRSAHGKA